MVKTQKLEVVRKKASAPVQNYKHLSFIKRGYHEILFFVFLPTPVDQVEEEGGLLIHGVAVGVQVSGLLCSQVFT
jgi:hypothetical protein